MRHSVLPLDPTSYRAHPLHGEDRVWQETNCAADLWIEGLHALGFDPTMALGFTLSADFDGDQWRMFKFDPHDLRVLFGIEYDELNVWRPLGSHVAEQLGLGRLVTVDVDAWHLPDTAGLTYRCGHQKTTILAVMVDTDERRLGYLHNTGYYELDGDDYAAILETGGSLPPYVESIRLDGIVEPAAVSSAAAVDLGIAHLGRRPPSNPVSRLHKRVEEDLPWLVAEDLEVFHRYAFGTIRQCGANAELAATFAGWLAAHDGLGPPGPAADRFAALASGMKSLEFVLARAAAGRAVDLGRPFQELEECWEAAMAGLAERYDRG
jgi:hypothetical protein